MDIATIAGLIISTAGVLVGLILSGGTISSYLQLASAVIVFVGTIGATVMCYPLEDTINVFTRAMFKAFKKYKVDNTKTVDQIIEFAGISRKDGLLSIEKKLKAVDDDFLKKGLQLAVDGVESNKIIDILEADMEEMDNRHNRGAAWMATAGGYSPTFGMIGTVLGLIIALKNMDSPEGLAQAVAAAFLTTLYGIMAANLFFLPVSKKLKLNHEIESREKQLMLRGILAIQSGANPRIIKEELLAFLKEENKKNNKKEKEKPKKVATSKKK